MCRICLITLLTVIASLADTKSIGVATVVGSVRVDSVDARGTATVMDGASIETNVNPSQIALTSGSQVDLAADSEATIYAHRLVLAKGWAQVENSSEYSVVANSLRVVPKNASDLRVGYVAGNAVQVSVLSGEASVLNREGCLLAKVVASRALEFTPEHNGGGQSEPVQVRTGGCISTGASAGPVSGGNKAAAIAGVTGAVVILTVAPLAMAGAFSGGRSTPVSPQ